MNIFTRDLKDLSESGFMLVVADPIGGDPTDIKVWVKGSDSKAYRKAKIEAMREMAKSKIAKQEDAKTFDEDEWDEISILIYSKCVIKWENIEGPEGPIECTPENVEKLLRQFPWFLDQVAISVDNRANFLKPSE